MRSSSDQVTQHVFPGSFTGDDAPSPRDQERVSVHMVNAPVGVEYEPDRPGCHCGHSGLDLINEPRELIVDEEGAVLADGYGDIPTGADEHGNVPRDGKRFDLNFRQILRRGRSHSQNERRGQGKRERLVLIRISNLLLRAGFATDRSIGERCDEPGDSLDREE